jgi:polysaccharide export outer membrane protein
MAMVIPFVISCEAAGRALLSGVGDSEITEGSQNDKSSLIVTSDYEVGSEDVLDITVWKNADLSKTVQVRPDGKISLPLVW